MLAIARDINHIKQAGMRKTRVLKRSRKKKEAFDHDGTS
jgi:hypothetical protein